MLHFRLDQFVDLRAGERRLFLRIFSVLLLTILGHTVLETARDALFLSQLPPEKLTFVYVFAALGLVLVTPLSVRLTRAVGVKNAFVTLSVATAFGAAVFRIRPPSPSSVFALYVFGTLSATVLITQCWLLAGSLFTAAQSRRLSGALASGGVLGAVVGAGLASLLLTVAPVRSLLGVSTLAYFAAAFVATRLPYAASAAPMPVQKTPMGPEWSKIRREPFMTRLSAIAALSIAVSVLVDYLYKAKVSSVMSSEELGPFFARYQLVLNLGSLFLQLLVTGSIVQRVGVVGLSLTTPMVLSIGAMMTALLGAPFALVVGLKATDTALRNSFARVAAELLWAPVENQARGRALVDLVITRCTQALTGAALLAVTMNFTPLPASLAGVAAALGVLWLVVGAGLGKDYIALFRGALHRGSVDREFTRAELDFTSMGTLVEALARPDPVEVLAAMNVLAERKRDRLIPALILHHDDEGVLLRALELFGASRRQDWVLLGERLLERSSPAVQQAIVRTLAQVDAQANLERLREHENASVKTFALLYQSRSAAATLEGDPLSWDLFKDDDASHRLKRAFIDGLAAHPTPEATRILLRFAQLAALRSSVAQALAVAGDESSISFLIERLRFADDRIAARSGLLRLGDPALFALTAALKDDQLDRRIRIHVPRSIAAFTSQKAVDVLLDVIVHDKDGLIRYKALLGLEQVALERPLRIDSAPVLAEIARNSLEYLRLFAVRWALTGIVAGRKRLEIELVSELLDDKIRQARERIARLLQIMHRGDDIQALFAALDSSDPRQHGRAVEFLDALIRDLDRRSDREAAMLRLVVDNLLPAERVRRAAELVGPFNDAQAALRELLRDNDAVVRDLVSRALHSIEVLTSSPNHAVPLQLESPA